MMPPTEVFQGMGVRAPVGATVLAWALLLFPAPAAAQQSGLRVKPGAAITIDGDPSEWRLWEFQDYSRGGELETGDIGLVGWLDGSLYYGENYVETGFFLPTSAADHAVRFHSRHDATYQYFLFRLDDSSIGHPYGVGENYRNDCVEFFVDPANADSPVRMWDMINDSTFELVIDVLNQKNVYMTPSGYRTQLLAGVTSAVSIDATGWWLEVRIAKSVTNPPLPAEGVFGVSFFFRDYDGMNNATLYGWTADYTGVPPFPSKIPANFGDVINPAATFFDCNGNGTPDGQDIASLAIPDCNANAIPDDCDITYGLSGDCDNNDIPDECGPDADGDGVTDPCDNCVGDSNADQADNDSDTAGDACDPDDDNDTIEDVDDNCPFTMNVAQTDSDGDGRGDACDACPGTVPGAVVGGDGCPLPIPGDFDGDGDVDLGDFGGLQRCLGGPMPLQPACINMDINHDTFVNNADTAILQACLSGGQLPGDPFCVEVP